MPRVVVIGGANVDIKGLSLAPIIPATSNPGSVTLSPGGVGRNIAHNLALMGLDVALIAMVGRDANGEFLVAKCAEAGIDCGLVVRTGEATGTYLAMLQQDGELLAAINAMACADAMTPEMLDERRAVVGSADFLVADCNLPVDCLAWLCAAARQHDKRLLIEPVSVPKCAKLKGLQAFAVTPNADQAEALTGSRNTSEAARRLQASGIENVVIHLGSKGADVFAGGAPGWHVPALAGPAVRDVTGAGDAAVAGLVWGLVSGYSFVEAAGLGQAAAAVKLQSHQSVANRLTAEGLRQLASGNKGLRIEA